MPVKVEDKVHGEHHQKKTLLNHDQMMYVRSIIRKLKHDKIEKRHEIGSNLIINFKEIFNTNLQHLIEFRSHLLIKLFTQKGNLC